MSLRSDIDVSPTGEEQEQFFAGAIRRILKVTLILAGLLVIPMVLRFGLPLTAGFTIGALLSWLNFHSLRRSVEAIADRIVEQHSSTRGGVVVFRFLLRYVLVAACAYAIFKGSRQAFEGFLFGVCLPVAAMLVEAAYEAYMAVCRKY